MYMYTCKYVNIGIYLYLYIVTCSIRFPPSTTNCSARLQVMTPATPHQSALLLMCYAENLAAKKVNVDILVKNSGCIIKSKSWGVGVAGASTFTNIPHFRRLRIRNPLDYYRCPG